MEEYLVQLIKIKRKMEVCKYSKTECSQTDEHGNALSEYCMTCAHLDRYNMRSVSLLEIILSLFGIDETNVTQKHRNIVAWCYVGLLIGSLSVLAISVLN